MAKKGQKWPASKASNNNKNYIMQYDEKKYWTSPCITLHHRRCMTVISHFSSVWIFSPNEVSDYSVTLQYKEGSTCTFSWRHNVGKKIHTTCAYAPGVCMQTHQVCQLLRCGVGLVACGSPRHSQQQPRPLRAPHDLVIGQGGEKGDRCTAKRLHVWCTSVCCSRLGTGKRPSGKVWETTKIIGKSRKIAGNCGS